MFKVFERLQQRVVRNFALPGRAGHDGGIE